MEHHLNTNGVVHVRGGTGGSLKLNLAMVIEQVGNYE